MCLSVSVYLSVYMPRLGERLGRFAQFFLEVVQGIRAKYQIIILYMFDMLNTRKSF